MAHKQTSIADRIREALAEKPLTKTELADVVFADSPKAFKRPQQGGPYGCILPLSKALKNMGAEVTEFFTYPMYEGRGKYYWRLNK